VLTSDLIAADLSASVKQTQPIPDATVTVQQPGRTTLLAAPPTPSRPTPAVDASHRWPSTTKSDRPPSGDAPSMAGQPHPGQATRSPRVLLVDDNTSMRRVLRGLLEDAGIQVVGEATDGLEGVAQAGRPHWQSPWQSGRCHEAARDPTGRTTNPIRPAAMPQSITSQTSPAQPYF
jgi:hypothetical protein